MLLTLACGQRSCILSAMESMEKFRYISRDETWPGVTGAAAGLGVGLGLMVNELSDSSGGEIDDKLDNVAADIVHHGEDLETAAKLEQPQRTQVEKFLNDELQKSYAEQRTLQAQKPEPINDTEVMVGLFGGPLAGAVLLVAASVSMRRWSHFVQSRRLRKTEMREHSAAIDAWNMEAHYKSKPSDKDN